MSSFDYKDGLLCAESVPLDRIAAEVGTPFYCYATAALERAYDAYQTALDGLDAMICYALKANGNLAVVRTLAQRGAGADVVSEGELRLALAAGVPAERIVFAGVGKAPSEIVAGLEAGILQFNVESLPELETLNQLAASRGVTAPVSIRVNPDVDARTHEKISTGKAENKFGIDFAHARAACEQAAKMPGIALQGLAVHIGSQLTDLAPFRAAFTRLVGLYSDLKASGLPLQRLDFGGGVGIAYSDEAPPALPAYGALIHEVTRGLDAKLIFEPGRSIAGNAGILVTRTLYVKQGVARRFLIVDSAMNDLIRPPLYDAWHDVLPVTEPDPKSAVEPVDIVGPVCESADTLARQRPLPPIAPGDLLAICSTGAYGAVMASSYNMRLIPAEVLVRGADFAVVKPRQNYAALIGQHDLPDWLQAPTAALSRGAA